MRIFLIDFFLMNLICGPTSIPNSFKILNVAYFKSVVIHHFKGLVKILIYNLTNYYSGIHIIVKHIFNALTIVFVLMCNVCYSCLSYSCNAYE